MKKRLKRVGQAEIGQAGGWHITINSSLKSFTYVQDPVKCGK
jgi:hypothetical protein